MDINSLLNADVSLASKKTSVLAASTYTQSLPHVGASSRATASPQTSSCHNQAPNPGYSGSGTARSELPVRLDIQLRKRKASQAPLSSNEPAKKRLNWCSKEDELLVELRNQEKDWADIATRFPGRSSGACRVRYWALLKEDKNEETKEKEQTEKKVIWNVKELASVSARTQEMGIPWRSSSPRIPTPKKRFPFTQEEDDLILKLKEGDHLRWHDIAKRLPGRSVDSCEHRYRDFLGPKSHYQGKKMLTRQTE